MSILKKITTGMKSRPQKVVIYAPEGFGKSTLASQFPNPLFMDVEDSTSQMDVARLGRDELSDLSSFESALNEIIKGKVCSTIVVDTVDWLEAMVNEAVIASAKSDKIQSIEDFGYGKGYVMVKERVSLIMAQFDRAISAGLHVVLLAHAKVVKFEPPDGVGSFDRYELKLHKQVAPLLKEWADLLIFGNWRLQVSEKGKGDAVKYKGVGGKERVMFCNRTAALDAKNRHSLGDVEKWEIETIQRAFKNVGAPWDSKNLEQVANGTQREPESSPDSEHETKPLVPTTPPAPEKKPGVVGAAPDTKEVKQVATEEKSLTNLSNEVFAQLGRVLKGNTEIADAYFLREGKIKAGQGWADIDETLAKRIVKNPAGFIAVATKGAQAA